MTGTLGLAFAAGAVATVNPCGFALLPAYLARRLGSDDGRTGGEALARALAVGAVTSVGFLLVFATLGTAIALGAHFLTGVVPWAGLAIGVALALAGLAVLAGRRLGLRLPDARVRFPLGGLRGDLVFGVGYGTASLSCTLPVFLAAVGTAVTGSLAGSVLDFVAYAAGMGTVLGALALAAALSRSGLTLALRRVVPYVNRLSGLLLLIAGAYVVYYWSFFLLPGADSRTRGRSLIDGGGRLSSTIATWLGSTTGTTAATATLALLALLALWALRRRLLPRSPVAVDPDTRQASPRGPFAAGAGADERSTR